MNIDFDVNFFLCSCRPQARTGDASSSSVSISQSPASVIRISPQKVASLSVQNIPMYMSSANNKFDTTKPSILLPITTRGSNILERALTSEVSYLIIFYIKNITKFSLKYSCLGRIFSRDGIKPKIFNSLKKKLHKYLNFLEIF